MGTATETGRTMNDVNDHDEMNARLTKLPPQRVSHRPMARRDGLLAQEIGDEVVIYDQTRHQAHQLNQAAALLWRHADGRKTLSELASQVESEIGHPVAADEITLGLEQLASAHLLEEPSPWLSAAMTRRRALVKLGAAGGLGLLAPVVKSIVAPDAAMAQYGDALPECEDDPGVLSRMNGTTSEVECEEDTGILSLKWWQ